MFIIIEKILLSGDMHISRVGAKTDKGITFLFFEIHSSNFGIVYTYCMYKPSQSFNSVSQKIIKL